MTDVLIVGAGPTGLWLALELRTAGLEVVVIEKNVERDIRSRAAAMAAGSLETFATRGIAQRFIDAGVPIHSVHFGSSGTRLKMSRDSLGTKHPHSLMIPQAVTEKLLTDLCEQKGVKFFFGYLAVGLHQSTNSVTLDAETKDGVKHNFKALWLVGCDGTKSAIRELGGFGFHGSDGNISGWLADVLSTDPPSSPLSVNNESGSFLMQPLGHKDYYRVTGVNIRTMKLPPSATPTLQDVKSFAHEAVGKDFGIHSPLWFSRFSNTTRLVTNFRNGRVFVAGDAAHQFFPAGGQGITTGLQDAANLAWKLAAIVQGKFTGANAEILLNSYNVERRIALQAIIKSTLAQTALYAPEGAPQAALADTVYELIAHPDLNKLWVRRITGFGDPFPTEGEEKDPLLGARVTHLEIDGGFDALHAAMAVDTFLLVVKDREIDSLVRRYIGPWSPYIKYVGPSSSINTFGKLLQRITFPGYEVLSDHFNIAAAIVVPRDCRLLVTSGHVGLDKDGKLEEGLENQMDTAFENVEKSIRAAAPSLIEKEAWRTVYQITTYHKGGLDDSVIKAMFGIAEKRMGDHAPAWTAVGVEELAFGNFEITVCAAIP
ncbi:hypothetical protein PISL3812_08892 [Talaromyces islandicus]|uniref:FAD-binding domain-containing protein n=1 Tax=Talaromyces islandicus TaxID=28573 RepID=A0A0U1M8I3_TALIS|nr:hypothetical protein PISL3812_08892 [Talaromyces islandicus]